MVLDVGDFVSAELVDSLGSQNQKLCKWDSSNKRRHDVCPKNNYNGICGAACSDSQKGIGKYLLCYGSEVCGLDYRFIDGNEVERLDADFTDFDQLCAYKVAHIENHDELIFTLKTK